MRNLIVFCGNKNESTKYCAQKIYEALEGENRLIDLKKDPLIDIKAYDTIIIGGANTLVSLEDEILHFCQVHQAELLTKRLGIFICSPFPDRYNIILKEAFEFDLIKKAICCEYFGYFEDTQKSAIAKWKEKGLRKVMKENYLNEIVEQNIYNFIKVMNTPTNPKPVVED